MGRLESLMAASHDYLVNELFNRDVASLADNDGEEKAIPYMGWFWRDVDFIKRQCMIATDGHYVAICENNKWGYPERRMTPSEFDRLLYFLETAIVATAKGGDWSKLKAERDGVLRELRAWMQSLTI